MQKSLVVFSALLAPLSTLIAQKDKSGIPADTKIQTTASGLKYSVLEVGKGGSPGAGDKVSVHYTGWLPDGTKFDSSRDRGQPFLFTIGSGVIEGWSEALQLMSKGSRCKFTIPPALGYGAQGAGGRIPPNATLIFDIELLDFTAMRKPPDFKKPNKEAQKTTKSGLKYEVLKAGEGDLFKKHQVFKMDYVFWSTSGRLLQFSQTPDRMIMGRIADMGMLFLQEAPLLLKLGSRFRFEVPKKIGIPSVPGDTIWELELVEIKNPLAVPEFSMSAADKTKVTASGLKYEVIKAGQGKQPKATQTVKVHYAGWLTDGTLFDSSYGSGDSIEFSLHRVIPGWTEGIQLMKPGGIYKFTIPGKLAYGTAGSPPKIGPNATLVFYVELLEIK